MLVADSKYTYKRSNVCGENNNISAQNTNTETALFANTYNDKKNVFLSQIK